MSNIKTAVFEGQTLVRVDEAWQYDYGQILRIEGVKLPEAYEVHFSNTPFMGDAKTQVGDATGVSIPDEYFLSGNPIYAWVFLHTGDDDGETEYMVAMNVHKRSVSTDEQPTPVEQSAIDQAIAALNDAVNRADEAVEHYPMIDGGTWRVWDVDAGQYVNTGIEATGPQGIPGPQGTPGSDGAPGKDGKDGRDGNDGAPGEDGYSPTVTVISITGGHRVTITDENGSHVFDVMDGSGASITVDDALSSTSTNPVENRVITDALNSVLPSVTSSDNGKFLMVVNGVWDKAALQSAEGSSF